MEYRYLGNTGLKVSIFGFGNWVNNFNDEMTKECFKKCLENGINFFDTAEIYGRGAGETAFGKVIKELNIPREKIVVSTKIFSIGDDPNDSFLSRKHIREGLRNSLKRLQLDYVDIVFCHRYDMHTPLEETCRAMNWVIEHGYAFYWGTSEWTASQIMEAYGICDRLGLKRPVVEQCHYNMLYRNSMEVDYRDLFKKYKMGTTIWSPLESGILTGKYINETPSDSRANLKNDNASFSFSVYMKNKAEYDEKLKKLKDIAEKNVDVD
jgi:voltage-dependent potassium channel beta subunit